MLNRELLTNMQNNWTLVELLSIVPLLGSLHLLVFLSSPAIASDFLTSILTWNTHESFLLYVFWYLGFASVACCWRVTNCFQHSPHLKDLCLLSFSHFGGYFLCFRTSFLLNTFTNLQSTEEQAPFLSSIQLMLKISARKKSVNSISVVLVGVIFFTWFKNVISKFSSIYVRGQNNYPVLI